MLRVRKRRLQRWKYRRFKNQTSPSKSCYSSLRHHHPQMFASTICLRFPLLEAMGRVEHVCALKHNSSEPEICRAISLGSELKVGFSAELEAAQADLPSCLFCCVTGALTDRAGHTVGPHLCPQIHLPSFCTPAFHTSCSGSSNANAARGSRSGRLLCSVTP